MELFTDMDINIKLFEEKFEGCEDLVKREVLVGEPPRRIYIAYIDMLTDRRLIDERILNGVEITVKPVSGEVSAVVPTVDVTQAKELDEVGDAVLTGDTVLFVDGMQQAVVVATKTWPNRGVQTAENEVVVQGSKEAFTEGFRFNTALIRRRIKDNRLKVKQMKVGRRSRTNVALMYLDDVVRKPVLSEIEKRIGNIDIDAITDCGQLEQLIEDDWISPFPQMQMTERPDKAASAIFEGRIAVIVDNSPHAIIIPSTFNTFFHSTEDTNERWQIMSLLRGLRFIAGLISVCLPGLYIAMAVFHPSMLPMLLAFKMAASRQAVPFPAVVEILIMDAAFELIREAGIRLPGSIGGTVGIVGGLIVGQAAVEAGIVSPVVVVIIALTGISGFTIPNYSFTAGFRLSKYLIILGSAFFGLFGFWAAALLILIHLSSLKSFGVPYMMPFAAGGLNGGSDLKDSVFRLPLFLMKKRPFFANPVQTDRMKLKKTGNKKGRE